MNGESCVKEPKVRYVRDRTDELTLAEIFEILRRRFLTVLLISVIVIAGTFLYVNHIATPMYEATAKIKIPVGSSGFGSLGGAVATIAGTGNPDVTTQQEIIISRPVLEEVVKRTNLVEVLRARLKDQKEREKYKIDDAVDHLKSRKTISIAVVKNSPVIEIKLADTDRELARTVLSEILNVYVEVYVRSNRDERTAQLEILDKQIPELEREIVELGEKIKMFKLTKSISPSEEGQMYTSALSNLSQQKYSLQGEIQSTEEAIQKLNRQIASVQGQIKTEEVVPQSSLLQQYRSQIANLQAQYSALLQQYTEEHPEVKRVKAQMEQLEREIEKEIKRAASSKIETPSPVLQSLYSELISNQLKLPVLRARLEAVNRSIADIEQKMRKLPQVEQEYLNLERDYKLKQSIYTTLKQKQEELKLNAAGTEINKPQVIEPPYVPEFPSRPNKKLSLAIGTVLAMFLGIMGAFLREATDARIQSVEEIQRIADVPIIVLAKRDKTEATKTMFIHILSNYPNDVVIGFTSPDVPTVTAQVLEEAKKVLALSEMKSELISVNGTNDLRLGKTLAEKLRQERSKGDVVIVEIPKFNDNYASLVAAKSVDGLVLALKLKKSKKLELLKTLSHLEQNNVKIYGIIVL